MIGQIEDPPTALYADRFLLARSAAAKGRPDFN
jgi:hypothetical protein